MTERRKDFVDAAVKVGVLESNFEILTKVCTKMEGTLEKTQEVASNLAKIVAVQEERMSYHEKHLETHEGDDENKFDQIMEQLSETNKKIDKFQSQIDPLKKLVWMFAGGFAVIMTIIEILGFFLK